jgi:hypothetical protein
LIIDCLAADRQHAFRSTAAVAHPGGHHPAPRNAVTLLQLSFGTHGRRGLSRGRRRSS